MKRFLALLLIVVCCASVAQAELRGYDRSQKPRYEYVSFGEYPYEKDGTVRPQIWRALIVEDDVAFLITETIIDFVQYHSEKDTDPENPLQYKDTLMYDFCNTTLLSTLFTPEEQALLIPLSHERGLIAPGTCEELQNPATGFSKAKYTEDKNRQSIGSPYAYAQGLKRIDSKGHSWYFTADWRRLGMRWIVGDNGHISCVGSNRFGGLRPVIYVDLTKVTVKGGDGTIESPYQW